MAKKNRVSSERPPKEGEDIYVARTQIFGRVIEVGPIRGRRHGAPMYHVVYDRKGSIHEGLVYRQEGRLWMGKNVGVRGEFLT